MKICIAQTESLKGKVQENTQNHIRLIYRAIESSSDLIIFPELSITNYEPGLAKELVTDIKNSIFNPFQELSDKNEITYRYWYANKSICRNKYKYVNFPT